MSILAVWRDNDKGWFLSQNAAVCSTPSLSHTFTMTPLSVALFLSLSLSHLSVSDLSRSPEMPCVRSCAENQLLVGVAAAGIVGWKEAGKLKRSMQCVWVKL